MITRFKLFENNQNNNILELGVITYDINSHTGTFVIENDENSVELVKEDLFAILTLLESDEYIYFDGDVFSMKQEKNYLHLEVDSYTINIPSTEYENLIKEIEKNIEKIADFSDFSDSEYKAEFMTEKDIKTKDFNL